MNNIPRKLRAEMAADPYYKRCARADLLEDHICQPDPLTGKLIEWEHSLIFGGPQIQEKFAIIPICWWAHSGPGLVKEINVWIALRRATADEIAAISKVVNYKRELDRLERKYGGHKKDHPVLSSIDF